MSFQERSQSHSLMPAVDWVSVMKRKSQRLLKDLEELNTQLPKKGETPAKP
jgi:hypothetical protein